MDWQEGISNAADFIHRSDKCPGPVFDSTREYKPQTSDSGSSVSSKHPALSNYLLKEGDVLFARTGGAGSFGVVSKLSEELIYASYLIRFRFSEESFDINYQKFMFLADSFQLSVKRNIHGGVNQNIHAEDIKDTYICCPPLDEQRQISDYLNDQSNKYQILINNAESGIKLMQERRTALISAAVTGKVDVRHWEQSND